MKLLSVRVERRHIHVAETETRGGLVSINRARAFPLPENPFGGPADSAEAGTALAALISDMAVRGRLEPMPVMLFFDSSVALYREYRHRKASRNEMRGRALLETEALLPRDRGRYIAECEWYGPQGTPSGSQASAICAVSEPFLRGLSKALKARGFRPRFAGSALAAWSDTAKGLLGAIAAADPGIGRNVFALDLSADSMRLLLFVGGEPVHRREYSLDDGLDEEGLLDCLCRELRRVTLFSENREGGRPLKPDYVLIAGERAGAPGLAERIAGRLGVPCGGLGDHAGQLEGVLRLGGEMAERPGLYPRVASLAGGPAARARHRNFLYGGARRRRERAVTLAAFAAISLLAAAAMAALPIASHSLAAKCAREAETIERPLYAEARGLLKTQRGLSLQLESRAAEESYMQEKGLRHAALLYLMGEGLLKGASIESVAWGRGADSIRAIFTTDDIDRFLLEKEKADAGGSLRVNEPLIMEKLDGGLWRCDVDISWRRPV
ncbi:MAG: hypothetical protein LBS32_05965 [Clostridiales Family XIII bacterium]|jgi:hypothetical protein|nr:hypothetical protein [Clostridiales Family XIII bacterium]